MKIVKPLTKKDMIDLGIEIAESDIRFSKRLSQIRSSLGLEPLQDKIITPAMPHDVLEGYNQRMSEEEASNGVGYVSNKNTDYDKK